MTELLTELEKTAMTQTAELWNNLAKIVGNGEGRAQDLGELRVHIHEIQRAILAQAACRAYPDEYRLLGGDQLTKTPTKYCGNCGTSEESHWPGGSRFGTCSFRDVDTDEESYICGEYWSYGNGIINGPCRRNKGHDRPDKHGVGHSTIGD